MMAKDFDYLLAGPTHPPLPPRNLSEVRDMLGPWVDSGLVVRRQFLDGRPAFTINLIEQAAARFDLRAAHDERLRAMGFLLYEDAPAWLKAIWDLAQYKGRQL